MASTFSPNLALEQIGTGDQAGTWGTTTNTNIGTLIEQAISGYVTQSVSDIPASPTTLTIPAGASGVGRNMYILFNGAITAARDIIVPANRKLYFVYNNTTGGFAITVKVTGLTGVSVPNGAKTLLVCNGTDVVEAVTYLNTFSTSAINNTPIGATTAAAGTFTTVTVNGNTVPTNGVYLPSANTLSFATNTLTRGNINATGAWTIVAPTAGNHIVNLLSGSNGIAFVASTGTGTFNMYTDGSTHFTVGTTTTTPVRFLCNSVVVGTWATGGGLTIAAPTTTTIPALVATGGAATPTSAVTATTTLTINAALSNVFEVTLTSATNVATFTISNPTNGQTLNIFITQPGTGTAATVAWPASFKWSGTAPVVSTALGAVDLLVITYRSGTGFWYASLSKGFA